MVLDAVVSDILEEMKGLPARSQHDDMTNTFLVRDTELAAILRRRITLLMKRKA